MSENGEIYTAGKNFTLPPALTALTNSTSGQASIRQGTGPIETLSSDRTQLLEFKENWISIEIYPEKLITISGPIDYPAQSEPENLTCLILNLGGDADNRFQSAPIKASSVGLA